MSAEKAEKIIDFERQLKVLEEKKNDKLDRDSIKRYLKSNDKKYQTMECLYSKEEIQKVFQVFKNKLETCGNRRDYYNAALRNLTMFVCSLSVGLRVGDFTTLKWYDIMNENWGFLDKPKYIPEKTIKEVNGQIKWKEVQLTWSDEFERYIMRYLEFQRKAFGDIKLTDYIFIGTNKKCISRQQWWDVVTKACKEAGIEQKIGTHGLRKTMAHQYIEESDNKYEATLEVQKMLGHSDIQTTMVYACISTDNIQANKKKRLTVGFD